MSIKPNKYFLSMEFHRQDDILDYQIGEAIAFVDLKGRFTVGEIIEAIPLTNHPEIIHEYKVVTFKGNVKIAVIDYIFKKNAQVENIKTSLSTINNGFPLRT